MTFFLPFYLAYVQHPQLAEKQGWLRRSRGKRRGSRRGRGRGGRRGEGVAFESLLSFGDPHLACGEENQENHSVHVPLIEFRNLGITPCLVHWFFTIPFIAHGINEVKRQLSRFTLRWITGDELMQVSALYPKLFGFSIAAAHYLVVNKCDESVACHHIQKVVATVLSELPSESVVMQEAQDWLCFVGVESNRQLSGKYVDRLYLVTNPPRGASTNFEGQGG